MSRGKYIAMSNIEYQKFKQFRKNDCFKRPSKWKLYIYDVSLAKSNMFADTRFEFIQYLLFNNIDLHFTFSSR